MLAAVGALQGDAGCVRVLAGLLAQGDRVRSPALALALPALHRAEGRALVRIHDPLAEEAERHQLASSISSHSSGSAPSASSWQRWQVSSAQIHQPSGSAAMSRS